ncbi:hypothetical protein KQH65_10815 [archaeon]|nr:hypothetical protein [archaeon]
MTGERVCFTPEGFERFLSVLNRRFGSAGYSILYSMAKDFGIYDSQQMLPLLEYKEDLVDEQQIVQMLLDSISSHNWGKYEIEKFDLINGEIIINIHDNPFLELCDTKDNPHCFFMKGVLSGIVKEVTDLDFIPSTQNCKMKGNTCQLIFNRH